jgi:Ca2+-binding EF-hand superfamily protein
LLRTADPKNTGKIDQQELRWVTLKSGLELDDAKRDNLVALHDSRRDGQIHYQVS